MRSVRRIFHEKFLILSRVFGDLRIASHRDEKLQADLAGGKDRFLCGVRGAGERQDHFVGMAGAETGRHIAGDLNRGGFHCGVCHDKADSGGEPAIKPKAWPRLAWKLFQDASRAGGIGKFRWPASLI